MNSSVLQTAAFQLLLFLHLSVHAVAGDVAFAEVDQSYSEGRGQDNLFLTKDVTSEDVPVIIRLFSVSEFNAYRIREGRNVSDEDQARIDLIEVPAECKQLAPHTRKFN